METSDKIKVATAACDLHKAAYDVEVPEAVRKFIAQGTAFSVDGRCYEGGKDTFRLRATVPSWNVLSALGPLDDAVVGPDGDWKHAGRYLPLFMIGMSPRFFVVDLHDPRGAVGLFEEEGFGGGGDGYVPEAVAASLDEFVAGLVDAEKPSFDTPPQDYIWDALLSAGGDD